jgi:hypothetical protein
VSLPAGCLTRSPRAWLGHVIQINLKLDSRPKKRFCNLLGFFTIVSEGIYLRGIWHTYPLSRSIGLKEVSAFSEEAHLEQPTMALHLAVCDCRSLSAVRGRRRSLLFSATGPVIAANDGLYPNLFACTFLHRRERWSLFSKTIGSGGCKMGVRRRKRLY